MGSIVATLFVPGGKSLNKQDLDKVCDLLDIRDPLKKLLPAGPNCTYYLMLSTNGKIPTECGTDMAHPLLKLLKKGSDAPYT
jgi:hypothetical protein